MRAGSDTTDIQSLASLNQQCPPGAFSAASSEHSSSQGSGVNVAAIAGGVVGGCVFLGLIAAVVCGVLMLRRRRSRALAEKGLAMGARRNSSLDGKVRLAPVWHLQRTVCVIPLLCLVLSAALSGHVQISMPGLRCFHLQPSVIFPTSECTIAG